MSESQVRPQTIRLSRRPTVVIRENEDEEEEEEANETTHRVNVTNYRQNLSTISQIYLPNGNEYQPQEHVPPTGVESQQPFLLTRIQSDETSNVSVRLSVLTRIPTNFNDDLTQVKINRITLIFLFFLEPIFNGLILFPIIVLFWECGWNLILISLDHYHRHHEFEFYSLKSLLIPYILVQLFILILYLCQNVIYNFLKAHRKYFLENFFLKLHIFCLSTLYLIQWTMMYTIYDQYLSRELAFQILLIITSIFTLIVFNGHLSDLVCSPFLFSYDSIDYSIHFGCPLLTKDMKTWKINLINFILYEVIISNLSLIIWHGLYSILDDYFYPENVNKSAGLSLGIGYILYFILMYFQKYFEDLNLKYEFWTFISINFPQFYRNIRHFFAFLSCVLTWRGHWMLYDEYLLIFNESFRTYLLFFLLSFIVLAILQTSSSINGPLSHLPDINNFFPLYPHSYISILQRKLSKYFCSKQKSDSDVN